MTTPSPFLTPAFDPLERRQLWLQFIIILSIAVVPDTANAIGTFFSDRPLQQFSLLNQTAMLTARSLCVIAACICSLYLCNQPLTSIGLGRFTKTDFGLSFLVFAVSLGAHVALSGTVYEIFGETKPMDIARPHSIMDWYWFLLAHLSNGTAEELAIWGLLYTRLRRLWHKHELPSILFCAAAFATYHVYQGISPAIMIFLSVGLVHGLMYRATGRLWPLIIAHAASNIWFAS